MMIRRGGGGIEPGGDACVAQYAPTQEKLFNIRGDEAEELPPQPPAITRLAEIRVPTLLIVGQYDFPSKLKTAEQLTAGIPQARLIVIPGVAHLVNMKQPGEFNRNVLDFLSLTHP